MRKPSQQGHQSCLFIFLTLPSKKNLLLSQGLTRLVAFDHFQLQLKLLIWWPPKNFPIVSDAAKEITDKEDASRGSKRRRRQRRRRRQQQQQNQSRKSKQYLEQQLRKRNPPVFPSFSLIARPNRPPTNFTPLVSTAPSPFEVPLPRQDTFPSPPDHYRFVLKKNFSRRFLICIHPRCQPMESPPDSRS